MAFGSFSGRYVSDQRADFAKGAVENLRAAQRILRVPRAARINQVVHQERTRLTMCESCELRASSSALIERWTSPFQKKGTVLKENGDAELTIDA